MSRLDELKQGIVDIVKKEYRLQMVNMFEGNVSVRYEDKNADHAVSNQQGDHDSGNDH